MEIEQKIDEIKKQVMCDDDNKIKEFLLKNDMDISDTILELLGKTKKTQGSKIDNDTNATSRMFSDMRKILDAKDQIYQNKLIKKKY